MLCIFIKENIYLLIFTCIFYIQWSTLIHSFAFHYFSLSVVNNSLENIKWKIPEINNSYYKLLTIPNSVVKSHTILPIPTRILKHWPHVLLTSNHPHHHASVVQDHLKRMLLLLRCHQTVNNSLMLHYDADVSYSLYLIT